MIESFATSNIYPTPSNKRTDDGRILFKGSIALSVILHAALGCGVMTFAYLHEDLPSVTIQQIDDISIVPLSALDTQLQKGSPERNTDTTSAPSHVPNQTSAGLAISNVPKRTVHQGADTSFSKNHSETRPLLSNTSRMPTHSTTSQANGLGGNTESIALQQARINYQDAIATLLSKAKRYPERALKRRITGQATVKIEIDRDGRVTSAMILRSTESEILDEEVLAMVERASPFPIFPADLKGQSIALVVPIAFALRY